MYGHWAETSEGASLMDKLVYRMANMARWANNIICLPTLLKSWHQLMMRLD